MVEFQNGPGLQSASIRHVLSHLGSIPPAARMPVRRVARLDGDEKERRSVPNVFDVVHGRGVAPSVLRIAEGLFNIIGIHAPILDFLDQIIVLPLQATTPHRSEG